MLRYFLIPDFFVFCQVADRDFCCLGWMPEVLLSVTCTSLSAPDSVVSTFQGKNSKVKTILILLTSFYQLGLKFPSSKKVMGDYAMLCNMILNMTLLYHSLNAAC